MQMKSTRMTDEAYQNSRDTTFQQIHCPSSGKGRLITTICISRLEYTALELAHNRVNRGTDGKLIRTRLLMLGLCACLAFLTLFSVPKRQRDQQIITGLGDKSGYGDVQQGCGRAQLLLAAALRCSNWLLRRLTKLLFIKAIALPFVSWTLSDNLHGFRSNFQGALADHGIDHFLSFTGLGSGDVKEWYIVLYGKHNWDGGGVLLVLFASVGRRTGTGKGLMYSRLLWVQYLFGSKLVHKGDELLQQHLHLGTL